MISYFVSAVVMTTLAQQAKAGYDHKDKEGSYPSLQLTTERLAKFEASDYTFDLQNAAKESDNGVAAFNAGFSEALFDTFISGVVINFEKCGINLPHIHPRATEIAMVLEGDLEMGFIAENGLEPKEYTLTEGQVMVFPQASLHYQYNDSCKGAKMYAVLNHHDPGTLTVPARLNEFTNTGALEAAYGVYPYQLGNIIGDAPSSSPAQNKACLRRCSKQGY